MQTIDKKTMEQAINSTVSKPKINGYWKNTDTMPHLVNGKSIQLTIPDWVNIKFSEAFQSKWSYEELPATWVQGLSTMNPAEIRTAVGKSLTDNPSGWPPSLPEFIELGKTPDIDFNESFNRMIRKGKAKTLAEKHTFHDVGYQCRTLLREDKARRLHRETLSNYTKAEACGELAEPEQPALPSKVVRNPIDDIRNNHKPESFKSKAIMDRIERLRKCKK